ncbi:ribosomal RNA small subunit methyltransferase A [Candidatus Peregrinibacteria bacterium]|nr:ribosomal RNA small subunit methyltransferase A [Candidatus Peregrinibacteria bacterium]
MELVNPKTIKYLLNKYGLWTKKSFGQNFLINQGILKKIVDAGEIAKKDLVLEIGPGLGVLTQELAKNAKKVISIELDKNLLPVLKETLSEFKNIEIKNEDALKTILPKTKYKVVANIPYNITSPLITKFLTANNKPQTLTLLIQKEVAEKICALPPRSSILSLSVGLFATSRIIGKVSKNSFMPSPKVDSAIIKITPHKEIPTETALKILALAKQAFSKKRKTLHNSLKSIKNIDKILTACNVDPSRRPETLTIEEWKKVARKSLKYF